MSTTVIAPRAVSANTRSGVLHGVALAGVLALSAVLNVVRLSQNGYANVFYSAGVKSMLRSLHNFFFVSFDPGGLIMIDKPPLGLWVQAASAKLFGFSPLSLLLPEAIIGVLAVAALYWAMLRPFGRSAALAGALALALFPSFVAVSRDNNVDALLILLMILACAFALRASETGSWGALLASAVLVGLAFNTKTLAAYLVVPPIALGFVACAPGSLRRRLAQLLAGGAVMLLVSFAWIAAVELTPASQRPYVGGSTNNTELGLTFSYNGFGRVEGQVGGPGRVPTHAHKKAAPPLPATLPNGRARSPIAFGASPGPLRLFRKGLGDQDAWMLPFALFGMLALVSLLLGRRGSGAAAGGGDSGPGAEPTDGACTWRRDPRLAGLLILGGWFVVEAAVLSLSKGIVHPYYVSALGPGVAAMTGAGAVAFATLAARRDWRLLLLVLALATTVVVQIVLLDHVHYMHWFVPVLIAGAVAGLLAVCFARALSGPAMAALLAVLLIAPAAYAATTWEAPVDGTFPAAGPTQAAGYGGFGENPADERTNAALSAYVTTHVPGKRWAVLVDASDTGSPLILRGLDAGSLGGYSGIDPALDGAGLARLLARGEARYVVLGGAYADRGGNAATLAVRERCLRLHSAAWMPGQNVLVLYDCAGRERALAAFNPGSSRR